MNWQDQDVGFRKGASDLGSMPFPPGVGGRGTADRNVQNYDVISSDKAIDESNVGNRMLRNMGWTEGLVLLFPFMYADYNLCYELLKHFRSIYQENVSVVSFYCVVVIYSYSIY